MFSAKIESQKLDTEKVQLIEAGVMTMVLLSLKQKFLKR